MRIVFTLSVKYVIKQLVILSPLSFLIVVQIAIVRRLIVMNMKYGRCEKWFKANTAFWCSSCEINEPKVGIFKTSDYDLDLDERKAKYKDYYLIFCEKCN